MGSIYVPIFRSPWSKSGLVTPLTPMQLIVMLLELQVVSISFMIVSLVPCLEFLSRCKLVELIFEQIIINQVILRSNFTSFRTDKP